MAGLETIALAVAHLESIQDSDGITQQPPIVAPADKTLSPKTESGKELPYLKLHGRMVSDDSIYETKPTGLAASSGELMGSEMSIHGQYKQWPANDFYDAQVGLNKRKSNSKQLSANTSPEEMYQERDLKMRASGPAGILIEKISMVHEDLIEFFSLMDKLEQLALVTDGVQPADIPKPDEIIFQVQRYDVLLGRGGETNHHVGNIQYRQLVKACQPAYLAAKRRDKPRIAAAIVRAVRAHSGRFLKKHAHDNTWGDVGSVRAREKTSQALREGAPELRGTVESSRSQLLVEAVESSLERKARNVMDGSNVEFAFDPRQLHSQNMHAISNGIDSYVGVNPRNTTKHNRSSSAQSTTEKTNVVARPLIIPPKGLAHYPMHHHVPMPIVHGAMFYHHPHGHVIFHPPNMTMDGRYHQVYADNPPMVVACTVEPQNKRQNVSQTAFSQMQTESQQSDFLISTSGISRNVCAMENILNPTLISADNSEEEPVPIRSASPASSTASSKNASSTCRGPRLKLLKQRFEDGTSAEV